MIDCFVSEVSRWNRTYIGFSMYLKTKTGMIIISEKDPSFWMHHQYSLTYLTVITVLNSLLCGGELKQTPYCIWLLGLQLCVAYSIISI